MWQCGECPIGKGLLKRPKAGGWTGLANHAKGHAGWEDKVKLALSGFGPMDGIVIRKVSPEARNAYNWCEWVIMGDHPFSFVDDPLTRKYSNLKPITRPTLMKYLHALDLEVAEIVKSILPPTFGVVVDGWTCAKEHYFAVFAVWTKIDSVQRALLCCGVQDEDEDSDMDFSAESLGDYLFDELELMGLDFSCIEFISGDNTACNPKLARLISQLLGHPVPLIGCSSHKLNLAVEKYVDDNYKGLVNNIADLCAKLRQLKNASKLRKKNLPCALLRSIKWGSTYAMLLRYIELSGHLRDCNFADDVLQCIPSAVDHARAVELCEHLGDFNAVSKLLQLDGKGTGPDDMKALDMDEVRYQFDKLIESFPGSSHYLAADAAIVQNNFFERGIVKLQAGKEHELVPREKAEIRRFLIADAPPDDEAGEYDGEITAARSHLEYQQRKKARTALSSSRYRPTLHISSTTNMVERLFSRAKIVMTDLRKSMTPRNLEMLMFLRSNRHLWDEVVVQKAMLRLDF
jgi:hypothetical protein